MLKPTYKWYYSAGLPLKLYVNQLRLTTSVLSSFVLLFSPTYSFLPDEMQQVPFSDLKGQD